MMLDDLVDVINTLKERIRNHRTELAANETRTRMALVDPLLTVLGWDTSDPAFVTPEYPVSGGKADYGLRNAGPIPSAFIEAKKLDESLESHREQMTRYSNMAGVKYAGLTNGDRWELYDVFTPVSLDERRILDISILADPAHESALKLLLLWQPNLQSGSPVLANEPVMAADMGSSAEAVRSSPVAELLREPLRSPSVPTPYGWVSVVLMEVFAKGQPDSANRPSHMRFPDGKEYIVNSAWGELMVHTVAWLWTEGHLQEGDIPVMSSQKRYIVSDSPVHPRGNDFVMPRKVGGTPLFVETHVSSSDAKKRTIYLLKKCGINPEGVQVLQ